MSDWRDGWTIIDTGFHREDHIAHGKCDWCGIEIRAYITPNFGMAREHHRESCVAPVAVPR